MPGSSAPVVGAAAPPAAAARGAGRLPPRLVVVSHRLPFVVDLSPTEGSARPTVGGLVSGIQGYLASLGAERFPRPATWVGWPGPPPSASAQAAFDAVVASVPGAVPVPVDPPVHTRFYEGFSNRTLWPLCHSFPSYVQVDEGEWEAYRGVNQAFADVVAGTARPGDVVWVHDFHLMLLPALLRARIPNVSISYFHHVPFPSLDILRVLPDPWSRALLAGVLGADVAGFHTYDDVRKFVRAAERLLGIDAHGGTFSVEGRAVEVEAFPIGVDFARWARAGDDPAVRRELATVSNSLEGRRVVLSVDRLDYTKGILNRLLAFERLLDRRPAWRGHVSLVVIAVPSRAGVEAYRALRTKLEETVGRVNGRHGTLSWTPVLYQYRSLDACALSALYLRADVALVTPLRDGMNLVAKEFLATRRDEDAVLVLSDTAGAARELGEALLVNPFHVDGITEALEQGLEMPAEERKRRCRHMRGRLERYDVSRWGSEQFARLDAVRTRTAALRARRLPDAEREHLRSDWQRAGRRLVLLDYDGTLVPFTPDPAASRPDPELLDLLGRLARAPETKVVVVSGRDAPTLGRWLDGLPLALVAEHGGRVRESDGTWSTGPSLAADLRRRLFDVMQVFADRLPGAFVEEKDAALAWHWRAADLEIGPARARELMDAIAALGLGPATQVVNGRKVVEVRPAAANKGATARRWVADGPWGFVLAAGDDATDEDLFAALPASAWSLRVGGGGSSARFNLDGPQDLRALLADLVAGSSSPP